MKQSKTYRFKLRPRRRHRLLLEGLGSCRYVYNLCLDYKKQLYTGLQLSDRQGRCANGHRLDRDENAAINIRKQGGRADRGSLGEIPSQ